MGRDETYDISPASIFKYGSTLMLDTVRPNVFNKRPQLEAIMPFPTPEITPATTSQTQNIKRNRKTRKKKKGSPPETRMYFMVSGSITNNRQ